MNEPIRGIDSLGAFAVQVYGECRKREQELRATLERRCSRTPTQIEFDHAAWQTVADAVVKRWVETTVRDALQDRQLVVNQFAVQLKVGIERGEPEMQVLQIALASIFLHLAGIDPEASA